VTLEGDAAEAAPEPAGAAPGGAGSCAGTPEALFDEVRRLPDGALEILVEGRRLKITNWDKVLYPQTGFTKGDLIAYYAQIARPPRPALRRRCSTRWSACPKARWRS
jgi:hypothetical protein